MRGVVFLAFVAAVSSAEVVAAPIPIGAAGGVVDSKHFIPNRKFSPLPGKIYGVLVPDGQPLLLTEGRSGPKEQICFSVDGGSYRWIYVADDKNPAIESLQVPVGDGKVRRRFERLSLATPSSLRSFGLRGDFALVEVEVNSGLGCPPVDSFVATNVKAVDGTIEFPLRVADVVKRARRAYDDYAKDNGKIIDDGLAKAAEKAIGNRKPTGPREYEDVMFVTWFADKQRLRVCFRTRITDGEYQYAGGVNIELARDQPPAGMPGKAAPSRLPNGLRYGKQFGIEFGMAYEYSRQGALERTLLLPAEPFTKDLPRPPVFDRKPLERRP